ncbi:hypothetical protein N9908_04800 [Akkermansiaceae bacterium]|nr:hypothetical protein [Akkermansiaceae bacterium]MDB4333213.1 hypothetical protein [Akkermansiaceae bacterium]
MTKKHWLSDEPTGSESKGVLGALGWGVFLGTSWTWVIGMILPCLLIRDMGFAGFLIFALPNCIGAAAMGTILSGKNARNLPNRHWGMIMTFSIVTVAYHFYIAGYLLPNLLGNLSLLIFAASALLAAIFMWIGKDKGALLYSGIVWIISIVCFIIAIFSPETESFSLYQQTPLQPSAHMWAFLPASVGGFLLCPYLDATFIRARAKTTDKTGRWAFAFGFLVVFAAMIIFTTAYAHEVVDAFAGQKNRLTGVWAVLLIIHIPLQMGLTVTWHMREICSASYTWMKNKMQRIDISIEDKDCNAAAKKFSVVTFVGFILGSIAIFVAITMIGITLRAASFEWFEKFKGINEIKEVYEAYEIGRFISLGEIGYRCILICYGTLFPAYVMLMMVPTLYPSPQRRPWWLFTITVVLSTVTAYIGFVLAEWWGVAATLGIISIARVWLDYRAYREHQKRD